MLDSFFDLKLGQRDPDFVTSGSKLISSSSASSSSAMKMKDGLLTITVDTQDFDPEDLDILVEGQCLGKIEIEIKY